MVGVVLINIANLTKVSFFRRPLARRMWKILDHGTPHFRPERMDPSGIRTPDQKLRTDQASGTLKWILRFYDQPPDGEDFQHPLSLLFLTNCLQSTDYAVAWRSSAKFQKPPGDLLLIGNTEKDFSARPILFKKGRRHPRQSHARRHHIQSAKLYQLGRQPRFIAIGEERCAKCQLDPVVAALASDNDYLRRRACSPRPKIQRTLRAYAVVLAETRFQIECQKRPKIAVPERRIARIHPWRSE